MRKPALYALCLSLLTAPLLASAQPAGQPNRPPQAQAQGPGAKDPTAWTARRDARIRDAMSRAGVDAARAERVLKTIHQFDQERSSAQKALRTHYQKLEELLSQNSTDENAYAAALKGLRDGRTQLQAIQNRQIDAVAKILKPSEQARLVREGVGMFGPGGRQGKRGGMWQGGAGCPADAPCGPGMGRGRGPRGGF